MLSIPLQVLFVLKLLSSFTTSLKPSPTILTLHWLSLFWVSGSLYSCIYLFTIYLLSTYYVLIATKNNYKTLFYPTHREQIPHDLIFLLKHVHVHFTFWVTNCSNIQIFISCSKKLCRGAGWVSTFLFPFHRWVSATWPCSSPPCHLVGNFTIRGVKIFYSCCYAFAFLTCMVVSELRDPALVISVSRVSG